MKTVLVFRTSVNRKKDIKQIQPILNRLMQEGENWNFDLEDCDKILRIETLSDLQPKTVVSILQAEGFYCEEL